MSIFDNDDKLTGDLTPEDGIVRYVQKQLKDATTASSAWRKDAREDFRFVAGDQWDETDKQILITTIRTQVRRDNAGFLGRL